MIVKSFRRTKAPEEVEAKGFDGFELRLGDLMRGERATLGKSLLDVQRELKIKAAYIAAIENSDPSAFDTPGFIAGYVRSYARYLQMDPDGAFEKFCKESGFATAHGMSKEASAAKPIREERAGLGKDIFASSTTPFVPAGDAMMSGIEPGAIGSIAVVAALIGGLGYGGWTILQEVQKVQFAPVEQTPNVVADLDPLAGAANVMSGQDNLASMDAPTVEAFDRLYRPQALDVPVLVARDGPIAGLNPGRINGVTNPVAASVATATATATAATVAPELVTRADTMTGIQVVEPPKPGVQMVAVRSAWVRVRAADGAVIFEGIMDPGDTFDVPATEEPPTLRVGESGAIYFAVNGKHFGPVGPRGAVSSNVPLSAENLTTTLAVADPARDNDFATQVTQVAEIIPAQ